MNDAITIVLFYIKLNFNKYKLYISINNKKYINLIQYFESNTYSALKIIRNLAKNINS